MQSNEANVNVACPNCKAPLLIETRYEYVRCPYCNAVISTATVLGHNTSTQTSAGMFSSMPSNVPSYTAPPKTFDGLDIQEEKKAKREKVSDLWAALMAASPIMVITTAITFKSLTIGFIVVAILNSIFLIMDIGQTDKDDRVGGAWVYLGFILPPLYLIIRDQRVRKHNFRLFGLIFFVCAFIAIIGIIGYDYAKYMDKVNALPTSSSDEPEEHNQSSPATEDIKSYEDIYNEYMGKMALKTEELKKEYAEEAPNNTGGIEGLASLMNDKVAVLADMYSDGTSEMAKCLYKTSSGNYDEYQTWATKLYDDAYSPGCDAIYELYSDAVDGDLASGAGDEESEQSFQYGSYDEVYNDYVIKLDEKCEETKAAFLEQAPNNQSGSSGLYDIYFDQHSDLYDVFSDGSSDMYNVYRKHSSGIQSEYDEWRDKLYEYYDAKRDELYEVYSSYKFQ